MKIRKEDFVGLAREAWRISGENPRSVRMPQVRSVLYQAFYQAGRPYGFVERDLQHSLSHVPYQRILLYPSKNIPESFHEPAAQDGRYKYHIPESLPPRGKIALLSVLAAQRAGLDPDYERTPENMTRFYMELLHTVGENRASLMTNDCLTEENLRGIRWKLSKARKSAHLSKRGM